MASKVKRIVQVIFLVAFIGLTIIGKVQIWMFIFLGSVVAAILFGRFYCGWICPINTLTDGVNWMCRKLGIKRREVPNWIKNSVVRYSVLLLFISIVIFTLTMGKRLPVLPTLTILGAVLTLFFVPALWHRYICPYGTLLNITGSFARRYLKVDETNCIKCGACKRVCPAEAVQMESRKDIPKIDKGLCLECITCVTACPKKVIKYSKWGGRLIS